MTGEFYKKGNTLQQMPDRAILGIRPYLQTWQDMQTFTDQRDADTPDEIWLLQHEAVYTQGQAGKGRTPAASDRYPVVQSIVAAKSPTAVPAS